VGLSKKQSSLLALVCIVGAIAYLRNESSTDESKGKSVPEYTNGTKYPDPNPRTFAGYDCTGDCSGHKAGYRWAEEHDITDGDECDTAGEHSNSPSFAEGCHAYVDGESEPEEAADPHNDE
jgi:hypothetical protein